MFLGVGEAAKKYRKCGAGSLAGYIYDSTFRERIQQGRSSMASRLIINT